MLDDIKRKRAKEKGIDLIDEIDDIPNEKTIILKKE